ncbi:MAG: putative xanthine dehydrogenase subunit A [Firmicutes bacterium ADurb.Bin456]|nr:MAG: putative xanthine dehydrogenase subunit A [Firmicutes bacterium ADurb.Bin456]
MELDFVRNLLTLGEAGQDVALVTIIRTLGSTPRNAGTKMLVLPDGRTTGTIGGGIGEAEAKQKALEVLLDMKCPKRFRVDLTNDLAAEDGMVCGGVMDVFIDFIGQNDDYSRKIFSKYLNSLEKKENPALVTITGVDGGSKDLLGRKMVFLPRKKEAGDLLTGDLTEIARQLIERVRGEREPKLETVSITDTEKIELLIEPSFLVPHLLVLGGGHISKPLVNMASILGYQTTVVDDRPAFANKDRFPQDTRVFCQDFGMFLDGLEISPNTFVVIVTRGHQYDLNCLREMIGKNVAYTGMIGSERKVRAILNQLESEGVSPAQLKRVYTPIGLKLGSETPEEIALCILAEIVSVWRSGEAHVKRG